MVCNFAVVCCMSGQMIFLNYIPCYIENMILRLINALFFVRLSATAADDVCRQLQPHGQGVWPEQSVSGTWPRRTGWRVDSD